MRFHVIDKQTGAEPSLERVARTEPWAEGLIYCKMDGFAVTQDGELILFDKCGKYQFCPPGRFAVMLDLEK